MMKLGIITYHNTTNLGALLQAFALQQFLLNHNINCEIIDYDCERISQRELPHFPLKVIPLRRFLAGFLNWYSRKRKKKAMQVFENEYLILSQDHNDSKSIRSANDIYDGFIVGSDIVWETEVSGNDKNFFLDFADKSKKYSYASSFGRNVITDFMRTDCGPLLDQFRMIGVREESGVDIVSKISNNKASLVVDPTLLLTSDEWTQYFNYVPSEKNYVLLYFLDAQGIMMKRARELPEKFMGNFTSRF